MSWSKALFVGALLLAGPAAAEDDAPPAEPYAFGAVPGYIMMAGPTFGGSFGSGGGGGFVGAEWSVNRLSRGTWVGLYADGMYDFGRGGAPLFSVGPQLGYPALGVDAGAALRLRDGEPELGVGGRLLISVAVFSIYGRYGYFVDSGDHLGQVGLMLKLPIWASESASLGDEG